MIDHRMKAIIITIGDEILLGQILDTNSQYIARHLTSIGVEVLDVFSISDKREEITEWVDYAMKHARLVIVTGGLGPTKDDVTKQTLSDYFGMPLVLNREVLVQLEEMLQNSGLNMNERNRGQAFLPEGCKVLHNRKGTAPGMWFDRGEGVLVSLPGVPFEMEELMEQKVIPELKRLFPNLLLEYRMVKVYNIPESELAGRLADWEERLPEGISLAYLPSPGLIKLRLTAKEQGVPHLNILFESLQQALEGLWCTVGEHSGIERELGELLMIKGKTIAVAESCTGGDIAHRITLVPGASAYFKGGVVAYSDEAKANLLGVSQDDLITHGAVSELVVRQMAEAIQRLLAADYGVATSGIAGPGGATPGQPVGTVWIAVATPEQTIAQCFLFSFTRERNIGRASMRAIQMMIEALRGIKRA